MNYTSIASLTPAARSIVAEYAKRRGIAPAQLADFLNPKLELDNCVLPDAEKARARLSRAIAGRERVLIFGDYDADGVTATAILLRFLRESTALKPIWSLPNRQIDQYGLSLEKAKSLVSQYRPSLLICLDSGTNATAAIDWLMRSSVDTIVLDHHPLEDQIPKAVAMINPKGHPNGEFGELGDLCAAGLALVLCNYLARAWKVTAKWDRMAATMLAGLGTLADAVPMTPLNRAIAKAAIMSLNNSAHLSRIPGLTVLVPADGQPITQRRLQFEVIPPINALGRLESAEPGVTLLTTTDRAEAERIAARCLRLNEARKVKQREMVEQAVALARNVLNENPEAPVLILGNGGWHHGVAGPAASQVAERFGRSTILLGPDKTIGQWKGSGRNANGDNLGDWIKAVKNLGLVSRGGGHAGAIGLAATSVQIAALQTAGLVLAVPQTGHNEAETEVVGEIDDIAPDQWLRVIALLEPFGQGKPFPYIGATDVLCKTKPTTLALKDSGNPWGVKAEFTTAGGQTFTPVWRNCDAALSQWSPGRSFDLQLELTGKPHNGRLYFNWSIVSSRPSTDRCSTQLVHQD